MNRFIFDEDGGFLIVETKWGNVVIEQSAKETAVQFVDNSFPGVEPASHIEDKSYGSIKVISMVSDE